jgi:hypothetical protein
MLSDRGDVHNFGPTDVVGLLGCGKTIPFSQISNKSRPTSTLTSSTVSPPKTNDNPKDIIQVIAGQRKTTILHPLTVNGRGSYRAVLPLWEVNYNLPVITLQDDEGFALEFSHATFSDISYSSKRLKTTKPCATKIIQDPYRNKQYNKEDKDDGVEVVQNGCLILFEVSKRTTKQVLLTIETNIIHLKLENRIHMKFVDKEVGTESKEDNNRGGGGGNHLQTTDESYDASCHDIGNYEDDSNLIKTDYDKSHGCYKGEFTSFIVMNVGCVKIDSWMKDATVLLEMDDGISFKLDKFPKQLCEEEEEEVVVNDTIREKKKTVNENKDIVKIGKIVEETSRLASTTETTETKELLVPLGDTTTGGFQISSDHTMPSVCMMDSSDHGIGNHLKTDVKDNDLDKSSIVQKHVKGEKENDDNTDENNSGDESDDTTSNRCYTVCINRCALPVQESCYTHYLSKRAQFVHQVVRYNKLVHFASVLPKSRLLSKYLRDTRITVELENGTFLIHYLSGKNFWNDYLLIPINKSIQDVSIEHRKSLMCLDESKQNTWDVKNRTGRSIKVLLITNKCEEYVNGPQPTLVNGTFNFWDMLVPFTLNYPITNTFKKCTRTTCSKHDKVFKREGRKTQKLAKPYSSHVKSVGGGDSAKTNKVKSKRQHKIDHEEFDDEIMEQRKHEGERLDRVVEDEKSSWSHSSTMVTQRQSPLIGIASVINDTMTTIQQSALGNEKAFNRVVCFILLFVICIIILKM